MSQHITIESCLRDIEQLSPEDRKRLQRILDTRLNDHREAQFHVTFRGTVLPIGAIRTASTDLAILSLDE
jgi:hypothetical protein